VIQQTQNRAQPNREEISEANHSKYQFPSDIDVNEGKNKNPEKYQIYK